MYLYLVRHGETLWNLQGRTQGACDIPLSPKGILQAEALVGRLKDKGISQIYTSSLERAWHTASIIGTSLMIEPQRTDTLKEVSFGLWEGLTRQEIEDQYPGQLSQYRADYNFAPPHGESLLSLQERIDRFLRLLEMEKADRNKNVLLVAHAYPLRMLIVRLLGLDLHRLWSFQQSNTGITIIRQEEERARLICFNDTCHIDRT